MEVPYVVTMPPIVVSAPGVLLQVTAGDHPLVVFEWKVGQDTLALSQLHTIGLRPMATPAEGAATTPRPLGDGAAAAGFTARVGPFSDHGAAAAGGDYELHPWNVVNSSLPWNPVPTGRLEVPRGATLAIRLASATVPTPMRMFGYMKVLERR